RSVTATKMRRPLSPTLAKLAEKEVNETPDRIQQDIIILRVWIRQQPHLRARTDVDFLIAFLRRCRYSLEETKRRIDRYFTHYNLFPEIMNNRCVTQRLLDINRMGIHVIPSRPVSPEGPRVIISQFRNIDPKKSNPREAFKLVFIMLELLALECDNASISGLIWVVDARDVTMEQMMQYDPFLLKKAFALVDQCMPLKFVEIHMINMRKEGQTIFNFVTKFLPSKLPFKVSPDVKCFEFLIICKICQFVVHKKSEDLYQHLPREAMTIEYGGTNGYQAEAIDHWRQKLQDYKDYLAKDAQYGTNEKLRVGLASAWANGELDGMSGSFRKLELD
ncbi:hypothetical protein KR018_001926, partial [Drosophila ironensis]